MDYILVLAKMKFIILILLAVIFSNVTTAQQMPDNETIKDMFDLLNATNINLTKLIDYINNETNTTQPITKKFNLSDEEKAENKFISELPEFQKIFQSKGAITGSVVGATITFFLFIIVVLIVIIIIIKFFWDKL